MQLVWRFDVQGAEGIRRAEESARQLDKTLAASAASADRSAGRYVSAFEAMTGRVRKADQVIAESASTWERNTGRISEALRSFVEAPSASAGNALAGLAGRMGSVGAAAAGVGAAFAAVGAASISLVAEQGAAAESAINLADRLNITVGSAEKLSAMARIAGVNIGALEGSARLLANATEETEAGLNKLGVSTRTASGELRDYGSVLVDALERLGDITDANERVAAAQRVMTRGGVAELIPLIKNYRELRDSVDQLGIGLNEGLTRSLANADDELGKLSEAWKKFKKEVAGGVAVPVTFVLEMLTAASRGDGDRYAQAFRPGAAQGFTSGGTIATPNLFTSTPTPGSAIGSFDFQQRSAAQRDFLARFAQTREGRTRRLAAVGGEIDNAIRQLSSTDLGLDARGTIERKLQSLNQERATLEASLKVAQVNDTLADQLRAYEQSVAQKLGGAQGEAIERFVAALGGRTLNQLSPDQRNRAIAALSRSAGVANREALRPIAESVANADARRIAGDTDAFGRQLDAAAALEARLNEGRARFRRQDFESSQESRLARIGIESQSRIADIGSQASFDARRIAAMTRPGGELNAIMQQAEVAIKAAQAANQAAMDAAGDSASQLRLEFELAQKIADIRRNSEAEVLEFRKRGADNFAAIGSQLATSSIAQGGLGAGLRNVITGQAGTFISQVGGNIGRLAYDRLGPALGRIVPGQRNADGSPSIIGQLLGGTLLDSQNALVSSQDRLKVSIDRLTATVGGGMTIGMQSVYGGDGGFVPGAPSDAIFSTGATARFSGRASQFFSGAGSIFGTGLFRGFSPYSVQTSDGVARAATGAERAGNILGSAALVGAGTYGVIQGIREGGARGATSAAASALTVASAIPGPQQPFIQAAALVAGLVRGLIPSARESFGRDQDRIINARQYQDPSGYTDSYDLLSGAAVSYGANGMVRTARTYQVTVNVSAMDAKGFMERSTDIGNAVVQAIQDGNGALTASIQRVTFGAP